MGAAFTTAIVISLDHFQRVQYEKKTAIIKYVLMTPMYVNEKYKYVTFCVSDVVQLKNVLTQLCTQIFFMFLPSVCSTSQYFQHCNKNKTNNQ